MSHGTLNSGVCDQCGEPAVTTTWVNGEETQRSCGRVSCGKSLLALHNNCNHITDGICPCVTFNPDPMVYYPHISDVYKIIDKDGNVIGLEYQGERYVKVKKDN